MRRILASFLTFTILAATAVGSAPLAAGGQRDVPSVLRWKDGPIKIAISRSMFAGNTSIKVGSDVSGAIDRAFAAWKKYAPVEFEIQVSEKDSVSPSGIAGDGVSLISIAPSPENVLFFGKDAESLSARTRVFYNRRSFITEADIILSPFQQFSTDNSFGSFDLETTLRHEIGHLLGLKHSNVLGAVMYDSTESNGPFGRRNRTNIVADDDISAIRALYPSVISDEDCCGSINGQIRTAGRAKREFRVWVQELGSGRVVASSTADRTGAYKIDGLGDGSYEVYAEETNRSLRFSAARLGEVSISGGESVNLTSSYIRKPLNFSVDFIGRDSVLSDSPIYADRDVPQTYYVGGKGLFREGVEIKVDSPFITIDKDSLSKLDYSSSTSAFGFRVTIDPETPAGNYSIYAVTSSGERDYCIGGFTVGAR